MGHGGVEVKRIAVLLLLVPAVAAAYSDRALFDAPAIEGGAGGRYFTGSRADGYGCNVCHGTATTDDFTIDPLPEPLVPGRRYDLTIHWNDPTVPHGLHVELTANGTHPQVMPQDNLALPPASRCGGVAGGMPAVYTIDSGVRRVIGVEACGASSVTLSFLYAGAPVELAVGGVRGDASDTAIGDRVFERHLTIDGRTHTGDPGGCTAGGGAGFGVVLVLLALVRARSRTAR